MFRHIKTLFACAVIAIAGSLPQAMLASDFTLEGKTIARQSG